MGFLDKIKELFGKPKEGLPDNFGAPTEFKQTVEGGVDPGKQKANEIADKLQQTIPTQAEDSVTESMQNGLNDATDTMPPSVASPTPVPPSAPEPPVSPPESQPPQTPQTPQV